MKKGIRNNLFIAIIFNIILFNLSAQFNFKLSKNLSDNFGEMLVTIGEDNGKVYLYDEDKLALISYDVAKDSYIKTKDKYYEEAGVLEPHSRLSQNFFITKDYIISCYMNIEASRKEKKEITLFFFLFFDKDDLSFTKKVEYDVSSELFQYVSFNTNFWMTKNQEQIIFGCLDPLFVMNALDLKTEEITQFDSPDLITELNKGRDYSFYYINVANDGSIYTRLNIYKKIVNKYGNLDTETTERYLVKFKLDGGYEYEEIASDVNFINDHVFFDEKNNKLYYLGFASLEEDKESENNKNQRISNAYYYYEFDENLKLLNSIEKEHFDENLIKEANQDIDYEDIDDSSIGLISFFFSDFTVLNDVPILILEHKVLFKNGTFYPSFLVMFFDEKGKIENYTVVKRWNSNGGDDLGKRLSDYKICYAEDAIYIIANFNARFEPFKGEKEFEATQFGYCKITADEEVEYTNILPFSDANYFGIINNQAGYFGIVKKWLFDINDGNVVFKFQQEKKGIIPKEFEKYKYFYATAKLE